MYRVIPGVVVKTPHGLVRIDHKHPHSDTVWVCVGENRTVLLVDESDMSDPFPHSDGPQPRRFT